MKSSSRLLSRFALAFTSGARDTEAFLYTPNFALPSWGTLLFVPESSTAVMAEGVTLPILAAMSLSTKVKNPLYSYSILENPDSVKKDPFASFITSTSNPEEKTKASQEAVNIDMDRVPSIPYRLGYLDDLHEYGAPTILCSNGKFIDTRYKQEIVFPQEAILPGNLVANQAYKDYLSERCNQLVSDKESDAQEYLKTLIRSPEGIILTQDLMEESNLQKNDVREYLVKLFESSAKLPSAKTVPSKAIQFSQNQLAHQK